MKILPGIHFSFYITKHYSIKINGEKILVELKYRLFNLGKLNELNIKMNINPLKNEKWELKEYFY